MGETTKCALERPPSYPQGSSRGGEPGAESLMWLTLLHFTSHEPEACRGNVTYNQGELLLTPGRLTAKELGTLWSLGLVEKEDAGSLQVSELQNWRLDEFASSRQ